MTAPVRAAPFGRYRRPLTWGGFAERLPASRRQPPSGVGPTQEHSHFFLRLDFPALAMAMAIACFCGFPACISFMMLEEMVFLEEPFFSGISAS